ncbi:alpha/beta hydrolase [Pseudodonghicola sp.]|uniref:alpha/beta hydrolase n=1 Tax=Pseudodonghicola sp. TaxID=1969463 RepID=UPI003A981E7B
MRLAPAPLFADVAGAPPGGAAHWLTTEDGPRIRIAHWRPEGAAKGTVLLFPGRTEYIEKYGPAVGDLAARGFATLVVDWRGQGLADRLLPDPRPGHVANFPDYQRDVAALTQAAALLDLPGPWFLIAHSMGGCIGLRALIEGLPVAAAAFTGPMWAISLTAAQRTLAHGVTALSAFFGLSHRLSPGTKGENYFQIQPFEGNGLTNDPEMYRFIQSQLQAHPELGIGGPSLQWLREALRETARLAHLPAPDLPCITFFGTADAIVSGAAIRARMANWRRGELELIEGGKHEVLMEDAATRAHAFDRMAALFDAAR